MAESLKGYPMKKGKIITVKYLKQGTKKDGTLWQCFSYAESKRNQATGQYQKIVTWSIFPDNPISKLQENDRVEIKSISSVSASKNYSNGKEYFTITINCEVELVVEENNPENLNLNETQNPFDFSGGLDIENLDISDDDLNFLG